MRAEEGHFSRKQPVPTATPEDDPGEKAEPRRYALLTLIHRGYIVDTERRERGSHASDHPNLVKVLQG